MINPKETLRICEAAEAEENTGKLRRVACLNRADYAVEALPEYAAWVKDALPFLEQARADACADGLLLAIDPESKECIEAHQRIFALMKLLARVKHE